MVAVFGGHHPGAKKGPIMQTFLVLAIIVILAFALYRFMRTRSAR